MNNFIYYYYNMQVNDIYCNSKYCSFVYNEYIYKLYVINDIINDVFLINLNKRLLGNTLISEIIFNRDGKIISNYNNNGYILIKIFVNPQKKIVLDEISYLANSWIVKKLNVNWANLWERKIDYLEKLINENGKKYPIITDSFNYFVGMTENAISYYNNTIINDNYTYVISHKKIRINDTIDAVYNPLNIIFDYRVRDVAEYIKRSFFDENKNIFRELDIYFKNYPLSKTDARLLVARLMYPSFYFEMYEDILIDNAEEKIIVKIVDKLSEYEKYLNSVISYLNKLYVVEEISWLNHYSK